MTTPVEADTFYSVAAQLGDIDKTDAADMNTFIKLTGINAHGYEGMLEEAAEIQVYDGTKYTHYYYINEALSDPIEEKDVEGDVWTDMGGYLITDADILTLSQGFWFRVPAASYGANGAITTSGQVSMAKELGVTVIGSASGIWNLVSNPFPMASDFRKFVTSGLTAHGYEGMLEEANEIQVFDGATYAHYYYINEALTDPIEEKDVEGDVWTDMGGYLTTDADIIPAGKAFWLHAFQNGSLTFSQK